MTTGNVGTTTSTHTAVDDAWRRHRQWSAAADAAKERIARWRLLNLVLLALGAVAGAVAAVATWPGSVTGPAAGVATVALGAAGAVQARFLNAAEVGRWAGARAASESLKAEVYRYLSVVDPYAHADRDTRLNARVDEFEAPAKDLLVAFQLTPSDNKPLPPVGDLQTYVEHRAQHQANWHRDKIKQHQRRATWLRRAALGATAVAAVLSAIAATAEIDLAIWIGAASTIAAAFTAHLGATRHDQIAAAYAVTADQIDRLVSRLPQPPDPATAAHFVESVERVLIAQNEGWVGLVQPG